MNLMTSIANMEVLSKVVEESVWDMPPCHWIICSRHFKGTFLGIWLSEKKWCKFDAVLLSIVILSYYLLNLICMTFQYLILHPSWEV